jgi:hypothetical protein
VGVAETFNGSNSALAGVTLAVSTSPANPKVSITGNVLTNDTDVDSPHANLTASAGTTSTNSGVVSMNSNGTFTYTPQAGFTGDDTISYTVHDNEPTDATGTGTITVHVVGPRVWFVDPTNGSDATGTGTSLAPFKTLAPINTGGGSDTKDGTSDVIFSYHGAAATGGFVLEGSQLLVGEPQGLSVTDSLARTFSLVSAASTNPTISNSAGTGLQLADAVTVQAVTVQSSSGSGISSIVGTPVNSATIASNVSISGNGGAELDLAGGTGAGTINVAATITNGSAGRAVAVTGRTAGTDNISGPITDSGGTGVSLTSNTGGTLNFSGGLGLSTGSNSAFSATGGGTVNVTQNNTSVVNTLTTTTGTALTVTGTTIGGSGLTFRSITAGTGAGSAGTGLILDGTGSTGGLTVTGTGTAGTGGTIQHKTGGDITDTNLPAGLSGTGGVGVFLRDTRDVNLSWMQINDFDNFAIFGSNVVNFTLPNSTINGVNGTNPNVHEGAVIFQNLTGAVSIDHTTIQGGVSDNVRVVNTTGTLNRIVFDHFTEGPMDLGNTNGNDGVLLQAQGASTLNATFVDSTLTSARGDIFQLDLAANAAGNPTGDLIFKRNMVNNTHPNVVVGGGGITLSGGGFATGAPTLTYDIGGPTAADANTFRGARGDALLIVMQTGRGTATGKIRNNVFGVAAVDLSGAREATDVDIRTVGRAAQTVLIDNNQMYQYGNSGIVIQAGDISVVGTSGTVGDINATITNNIVSNPNSNPSTQGGIHVNLGTTTGDTEFLCADIQNNNAPNAGDESGSAGRDYIVRQRQLTTMRLPSYAGGSTDIAAVASYIQGRNTNGASSSVFVATPSGGGGYVGGAGCAQP